MTISNVHEAKTNLSKLLDDAAGGNEVVITRRGGAVTRFKLMPIYPSHTKHAVFGAYKHKISFAPDYDTADQEITDLFEEGANN
ncbi:MAG TPA: type II toxin-antitoxin system Phd/YefM family antitoxin [Candidatus Saccharimonadales bacterium]|nr:type II toxin-antitoxin system Phd/YefM family antitoxin [Candidatus Saccharimonadales bacterium]